DGPSPTLVVDASGKIQTADNVSVNGPNHTGGNSTVGTSAFNSNGDVNVDDITNTDPGDIQFTTNSTADDTNITHSQAIPTLTISHTYDSVPVTTNPAHRRVTNNTSGQNTDATPQVELDAKPPNVDVKVPPPPATTIFTYFFTIHNDVGPTLVDIEQVNL